MKRFAKWMGILISVLFLSGSAWGYNQYDHITAAPNGKADLMFFKYFVVANGGWETKISVTNTNMKASVVAKVVIRSYKNSTELLDFLIYLSPADVWTARLYWDGTQTKIYSEDSSCLNQDGNWASPTAPLDYALKTIGTAAMPFCADDSTSIGYIYVVETAWSDLSGATATPAFPSFGTPGVSKADIKKYYELSSTTTPPYFWNASNMPAPTDTKTYTWNNSLSGYQVFYNDTLGLFSSAVQAQALKDYKCTTYLQLTATNRLGYGTEARNSLGEIEAALAKQFLALPYVEDGAATVHVLGFPTKYTRIVDPTKSCLEVSNLSFDGPFFNVSGHVSSARVPMYDVKIWDTNEVYSSSQIFSPSPTQGLRDEVNLIAVSSMNVDSFPEGWVSYPFTASGGSSWTTTVTVKDANAPNIVYTGAPVLSTVVFFGAGDAYSIDGAWSDTSVSVGGTTIPGYSYSDAYTITQLQ